MQALLLFFSEPLLTVQTVSPVCQRQTEWDGWEPRTDEDVNRVEKGFHCLFPIGQA